MDKTGTTAADTTNKKNGNRKSQIETDVGQAGLYAKIGGSIINSTRHKSHMRHGS